MTILDFDLPVAAPSHDLDATEMEGGDEDLAAFAKAMLDQLDAQLLPASRAPLEMAVQNEGCRRDVLRVALVYGVRVPACLFPAQRRKAAKAQT